VDHHSEEKKGLAAIFNDRPLSQKRGGLRLQNREIRGRPEKKPERIIFIDARLRIYLTGGQLFLDVALDKSGSHYTKAGKV